MTVRMQRAVAFISLVVVVIIGASWAKASGYNEQAFPSPHFSTSVKIARALFYSGVGDEPQALIDAGAKLPEPDWDGYAPPPEQFEIAGATRLPFQALRGPPLPL